MRRRSFIVAAGATLANAAARPAAAAPVVWKWAHATQNDHPLAINAARVAADVAQRSSGRLQIQLFGNNVLGGDPAMLTQVRTGAIQLYSGYGGAYESIAPLAGIEGVGFAFRSQTQALAAFDGGLGAQVRRQIDARGGLVTFERAWVNGFRQITTSTKPIVTVADLRGLRIRTPAAAIWVDLFKTLGAAPTPIAANEMYTALQTHIVDAQENPFTIIQTYRLFEVQKYISVTNHMWSNFWITANAAAFAALPTDVQLLLRQSANRFALANRTAMPRSNDALAAKLVARGMAINRVETAPFRAKLAPFYAKYRAKYGDEAWSLLEASVGKLG